jgi:uncharacterized membrane-anchored protein YitT (DUF2179 family)
LSNRNSVRKTVKDKKKLRTSILEYIAITFGAFLIAVSLSLFLVDAKVFPGSTAGLAMTLHYLFDEKIPVGALMWLINIPLGFWGMKELGSKYGIRSFYGFTAVAVFIDLLRGKFFGIHFFEIGKLEAVQSLLHNDFFFLVLSSAAILGIGLGIIIKAKGTTGGSIIVASILQKKYGIKPGMGLMFIDLFVITIGSIVVTAKGLSPDKPALAILMYSLFMMFVYSQLINVLADGINYARSVMITSDKTKEIADAIMNDFDRGVTSLHATGGYSGDQREVLMTVLPIREVNELTSIIKEIDPHAFVIVSDTHEILGKGFRRRI